MFLTLSFLLTYLSLSSSQDWEYSEQISWNRQFPSCGGRRQSPININTDEVKRNPSLGLDFQDYDKPHRNLRFTNNGHTVRITLNPRSTRPLLTGSAVGTRSVYQFEELHFHWGENNFRGSEHSIDHKFGSAEAHFVHYNKKYKNLENARESSDGIVVLTVLLQLSRNHNKNLQPIIRTLPSLLQYNTSAVLHNHLTLANLLPDNKDVFFIYRGSLTTPPCSESVIFIIMAEPIPISPFQLSQFRRLSQPPVVGRSQRIVSNTRNIHRKNGRIVEVSVPDFRRRNTYNVDNDIDY